MNIQELQVAYARQYGKEVPPRFKNDQDWICKKLPVVPMVEIPAETKEEVKPEVKPTTFTNPIYSFSTRKFDLHTNGTIWKVLPVGRDFDSPAIFQGSKEDAEKFYKSLR